MLAGPKEQAVENHFHENCFACGSNGGMGLGLKFYRREDGAVFGNFFADPKYEGYSGIIHGGIIATLLGMTHCLFMKDIPAFTGRLSVKYSAPIQTGTVVRLEARVVDQFHRLFVLEGKALVDGKRMASAKAKYRSTRRSDHQGARK